jgi:predicted nucleic acid-binding protein
LKLTFIDSGVLIYAARGQGEIAAVALGILTDSNREFASSIFVKLEVLPKAIYNQQTEEVEFYQEFFQGVSYWAADIDKIIKSAKEEASKSGLGAMDALHIAAAISVGATEFVTTEKPEKSIHRTQSIKVTSIYPTNRA